MACSARNARTAGSASMDATTNGAQSRRTILRQNSPVGAEEKARTESPFRLRDERLGLSPRHARKVIDVQVALEAEAHAVVALHALPIRPARRGDAHAPENVCSLRHVFESPYFFDPRRA